MDVKYVPRSCYVGQDDDRRSNERGTRCFNYKPGQIQTDNGAEFTYFKKTDKVDPFDELCNELGITHKLNRLRTP